MAVSAAFAYLQPRVANYPKDDVSAMEAWVTDLARAGVSPEELAGFVEKWAQTERFTPVPSDILGPIYHERQKSDYGLLILDPVKTGEHMGVPEIGSRERCIALGLPFVELREDELPQLPSPEDRKALMEKLENLPVKRMPKPVRERAEFDPEPDPEAEARAKRMVEQARQEA